MQRGRGGRERGMEKERSKRKKMGRRDGERRRRKGKVPETNTKTLISGSQAFYFNSSVGRIDDGVGMRSGIFDVSFTSTSDSQDGATREGNNTRTFSDGEISGIVWRTTATSRAYVIHLSVSRRTIT